VRRIQQRQERPPQFPGQSGSIISNKAVLTAAHCIRNTNELSVLVGEHDITNNGDGQQRIRVCEKKIHQSYDSNTFDYDYAVLILCDTLAFDTKVAPVCLPTAGEAFASSTSVVSGWGTLYTNGPMSAILRKAEVNTMTNAECSGSSTVYSASAITNRMLCASNTGKDACQGDSGGPLAVDSGSNSFDLAGIVSWGYGCAQANAPGVYARVTDQLDWIKSNMEGETCAKN